MTNMRTFLFATWTWSWPSYLLHIVSLSNSHLRWLVAFVSVYQFIPTSWKIIVDLQMYPLSRNLDHIDVAMTALIIWFAAYLTSWLLALIWRATIWPSVVSPTTTSSVMSSIKGASSSVTIDSAMTTAMATHGRVCKWKGLLFFIDQHIFMPLIAKSLSIQFIDWNQVYSW